MKPSTAFNFRAFVTLVVGFAFTLMAISGLVLFIAPRGSFRFIGQWAFMGIDREQWMALHFVSSLTVLLVAAFHLYNNRKPFWNYVRGKAKASFALQRELLVAVTFTALLTLTALLSWPPASLLVQLNDMLKERWPRPAEVRQGAVENMTLGELARELGYPEFHIVEQIEAAQLENVTLDTTVGDALQMHDLRLGELKERLALRGLGRIRK